MDCLINLFTTTFLESFFFYITIYVLHNKHNSYMYFVILHNEGSEFTNYAEDIEVFTQLVPLLLSLFYKLVF